MQILEGRRAVGALARGMAELAKLVSVTYGPNGSKVVVSRQGNILMTTDGSSLAHEVKFQGVERLGAALSRSASSLVDKAQGDGTSTTIILANALVQAALDHYNPRTWDPVGVVRDLRGYREPVVSLVTDMAREADEEILHRVALMTSHGDDLIGPAVVNAVLQVGENGAVLVSPGEGVGIEVDHRAGMVLDVGWAAHAMGKGDGVPRVMDGPLVAVVDAPLRTFEDVQRLMEEASQWPGRGLVLFCPKLTGTALTTLLLNDNKGVLPCVAVTYLHPSPSDTHDWLEDIAALTNATTVGRDRGDDLQAFRSEWLGSARKITVSRDTTEILAYPDEGGRVNTRVEELLYRADTTTSDYDRDNCRERAASMDGGLCVLKVGGYTDMEAKERRSRVEDTLHAVRETLKSGVAPGAGRALHFVSTMPELRESPGGRVLARALEEPLRVLCSRAGVAFPTIDMGPLASPWTGWCPVRRVVTDLSAPPAVADPTGVILGAFNAALSVACEVILTEVILTR